MISEPLETYLNRLARELRRRGLFDPRIVEEARDHLVDAIEDGRQRGLPPDAAKREAFARFGTPQTVATQFVAERYGMLNRWRLTIATAVRCWSMAVRRLRRDGWHLSEHSDRHGRIAWHLTQGTPSTARRIASVYRPSVTALRHTTIPDADRDATERVRQTIIAAAAGVVDPDLISFPAREDLVPALELFGPRKLGPMGALESFAVLDDTIHWSTRVRRYRASFARGDTLLLTVAHAPGGSIASIPRIDSADEAPAGAAPFTRHDVFWLPPGAFRRQLKV
ncbi:MAG: permease prefix domain 1-containing protein [Vicinamibacteraceae bacterium]